MISWSKKKRSFVHQIQAVTELSAFGESETHASSSTTSLFFYLVRSSEKPRGCIEFKPVQPRKPIIKVQTMGFERIEEIDSFHLG